MSNSNSTNAPILPRNGMTFAEFRLLKPGVLPDTILYNGGVALPERLFQIEGQWLFEFREGVLFRMNYLNLSQVHSEASFKSWLSSAKNVIADFTRSLGRPATHVQGEERYFDHLRHDAAKPANKRHVFQEANWSIAHTDIKIFCELKSNREDDDKRDDESPEYWSYDFQIDVLSSDNQVENAPMIYGRFYLGMPVGNFAERYPELFPQGTSPSGQWMHKEDWQGLQGEWNYIFDLGKLVQFQYSAYFQNDQVNQPNFQVCRKAALAIIDDFTRRYGKPNEFDDLGAGGYSVRSRNKNPYLDIVSAKWFGVEGMRVVVEFNWFYGDAAYQAFTVNVQGTDKVFGGYV